MKKRVLVVAAEEFELAPIRRALAGREDLAGSEAGTKNVECVLVSKGPGPKLVRQAVESAGALSGFDAVVSVGLCGALEQNLDIGTIVIGNSVNGVRIQELRSATDSFSLTGRIASVDYVAGTIQEKSRLRQSGAIAVEMEAAAVLEMAREIGLPFYAVKAVSDRSDEGFTLDLNAARDTDGRFSIMRIMGQAFRSPLTAFPELARLKRNGGRAANALGEFFAYCNF